MNRTLTTAALALALPIGAGCGADDATAPSQPEAAPVAENDAPMVAPPQNDWHPGFKAIEKAVADSSDLAGINAEEQDFEAIAGSLLADVKTAISSRDADALSALVSSGFPVAGEAARTRAGIAERPWTGDAAAAAWLAGFSAIDGVSLDVERMVPTEGGYTLDVRFDVRGTATDGGLRQDRGALAMVVGKDGDSWATRSLQAGDGWTLTASADRVPAFTDGTATTSLDEVPVQPRREAIRRGGYALAVADYDGDSRPDVLLGHLGPVQLLRNTPDGFVDVTKDVGLRGEDVVKAAGFADLDNDGDRDLVIVRFDIDDRDNLDDVEVYANNGDGTFARKAGALPREIQYDHAMPLALADFDGNGLVDIYIGFPGSRDFTNDLEAAQREGLTAQGMWLNQGDWSFDEAKPEQVLAEAGQKLFPHSALVTDLDSDRKPDLLVIDDSKLDSVTYLNRDGKLVPSNETTGIQSGGYGMSATSGDFDGDGLVDIAVTRIELLASRRVTRSWADRAPEGAMGEALTRMAEDLRGTVLYKNMGNGRFEDVTDTAGLEWTGQAPAGATFVDYDADGHLDLYVTNGLWSNEGREVDSLFTRLSLLQDADEEFLEVAEEALDHPADDRDGDLRHNPFMDLLAAHKGGRADGRSLTFGGHERNRLYRNNGDGTFTELGFFEGAARMEDGYVAAAADFNGDGREDLLLRNCDPAPGNNFPTVVLLENQKPVTHSLTVHLQGTESNHDGIGALVAVRVGDRWMKREIQATSGALQSEPAAFFGLGDATQVDEIVVTWPSGKEDRIGTTNEGRARLVEGSGQLDWLTEAPAAPTPDKG